MLAVPEHRGRISPVFDTCRTVLIFDTSKQDDRACSRMCWNSVSGAMRPKELKALGVAVLICGGISRWMSHQVESQTIVVIPWRSGGIREVVRAYYKGEIMHARFSMPGCCRFRKRLGHGQDLSSFLMIPSGLKETDDSMR
jgi:predicted Fe-Mo cluster-binding NifX family protein